jgi:hypothetical protein
VLRQIGVTGALEGPVRFVGVEGEWRFAPYAHLRSAAKPL